MFTTEAQRTQRASENDWSLQNVMHVLGADGEDVESNPGNEERINSSNIEFLVFPLCPLCLCGEFRDQNASSARAIMGAAPALILASSPRRSGSIRVMKKRAVSSLAW